MENKLKANHLPKTLSLNTNRNVLTPVQKGFSRQILKLKMNDIVDIALNTKPKTLYKQYLENEEMTIDVLKLMLIQFQDFYNVKSKMNDNQLTETAYIICQEYRHFNYYDIGMTLKTAKATEKIYDRIDGGMILGWLSQFDVARTELIIQEREKQTAQHKAEWSNLSERSSEMTIKTFLSK